MAKDELREEARTGDQRVPSIVHRVRRFFPNVDRVVDATKPLQVEVSREDVKGAEMMKENRCAMAKACERQPGIDGAIVKTTTAFVIKGNTAIKYMVPQAVTREIVCFDRNGDFRPGTYQLNKVTPAHKTGGKRGGGNHVKTHGQFKHRKPFVHKTEGIRGFKAHD